MEYSYAVLKIIMADIKAISNNIVIEYTTKNKSEWGNPKNNSYFYDQAEDKIKFKTYNGAVINQNEVTEAEVIIDGEVVLKPLEVLATIDSNSSLHFLLEQLVEEQKETNRLLKKIYQ